MPEKYYGPGVQLDSYHLQLIGIHPEYQKRGLGTKFFDFVESTVGNSMVLDLWIPKLIMFHP
jgi:ribosomal protein S18 acetylase RimI-like enzyme